MADSMDWDNIFKNILPIFGGGSLFGGILGYLIKSKIDARQKEQEWKKQYSFDDLKEQRKLLQEFLGEPWHELVNITQTNTQDHKRLIEKAEVIKQWITLHKARFSNEIQQALTALASAANSVVDSINLQKSLAEEEIWDINREAVQKVFSNTEIIKTYLGKIEKALKGKQFKNLE